MNIKLLVIGKTDSNLLQQLIEVYQNRLQFYTKYHVEIIPEAKNTKNLTFTQQKAKEGELLLKNITPSEYLILLDERGKEYTSVDFSVFLQKKMNTGVKQITFVIGGAFGFCEEVYKRANEKISLSKMTFSHQMIRLFFTEQLYRAFTILNNEPYHHQ
ncbi:23S rRNA (pseudouridine(1915)-N(3))-methyltransferase RlmH [Capnocytophaga catalasegens]|uniref:Ribosomal RNA large subunit methyltransferase H n=1 Tax=Capnocytophaga catalasegens TaxID=1004260 RepID=A0AAV5ATU2_9FLAO|nr:23S rRNA (pseudouridine(1915)-N(3))-methyltransferase RlmH [Capnocytophaga catalasegens]GIZ15920.1 ribosomal RNA large subunit methyltransferase H [Capnocytophaga catalasegens]GJM49984.1 ribosomal RNA large subunit methyltransferase H [Capnocytophaga catalasegens]GJM54124.1 ribosomal RNA large subunit methyltransferase H [Capnocytophaga catalasegens]